MSLQILGVITARGGSKGLPRKNVLTVAGRPLIGWTIAAAAASRLITRTVVSTDDEEIARVARECGGDVPFMRPADLAQDATSHTPVMEHALAWARGEGLNPDYLLVLQPTSPLRTGADIDAAITLAAEQRPDAVVSVAPAHPHPWLMHRMSADGRLTPLVADGDRSGRRQDFPAAFGLNGAIFLITPQALRHGSFCPPDTAAYVMPAERSIDIDSPWDLRVAELALS